MPVYESTKNAENKIVISEQAKKSVIFGWEKSIAKLAAECSDQPDTVIAIDGWYGINYEKIAQALKTALPSKRVKILPVQSVFKSREDIIAYNAPYVTEDPGFGKVNKTGVIEDIFDVEKVNELKEKLHAPGIKIVYGVGAASRLWENQIDLICYVDNTHQKVQWDMWTGKLCTFGTVEPTGDYNWKEYNYSDFYMLDRQKKYVFSHMDYYVENYNEDELVLIPKEAYDEMIRTTVRYPIHEVKIFSPGPWGAYRFLDLDYEVEGLENNAWNKIAGPELRILIDFGGERSISMPVLNLMSQGEKLVGEYIDKRYPGLFPLDIWLDDGYHPTPQPAERISMPLHIHPSSKYVEEHFDEPLGRYETYYIAEAYEGANTWMGFDDEADIEAWERKCKESDNIEVIEDWKEFISNWQSREGDLYLIPPGTMHGHGGNQMVLEMDTNPSINGTEYSFFEYDFARNSWDDDKKEMTGNPLKMHLDHAVNMEKNRRESWVKDHLLARPSVIEWTKDYYIDRYSTIPSMPYHVERIHLWTKGEYSTQGKFMHMFTLTVGEKVRVVSKEDKGLSAECDRFQTLVIPAAFGDYEIINEEGGRVTAVIQRWKIG
ncbi:MAG: hypothetical protein SOR92_10505 [Christensenella hongkongensis]|uniref:hypothetical protein n=1 Tax=Christensenella hongkongensis TaxID=270498 RepID=UPI002671B3A5|nr:hypothetical protein [Christensenella hongkongensis]MDY3004887.1 hypothetical protein [Christensenella hongkongensis]